MELRRTLFFFLFVLTRSVLVISDSDDLDCVYTIYVKTGSIIRGGTNSNISATLYASDGFENRIDDVEKWGGLMGPDHNYFRRGSIDIFSGRGSCSDAPICGLKLTSDGSGPHPGWYVDYVDLTSAGPHIRCQKRRFIVDRWLSIDVPPYSLTAVLDYCSNYDGDGEDHDLRRQG
ncbi:Polycystic kidney disease protein 1-like 2 [Morus notabilis]|uniref:Polycystic kidney disease protein 1-like 2 n=1 Tax=Morus notabilis TaxID=981085 RepID=W9S7S3_9ROSA|nr:PLAT domain-containing protein 3 [Morus notabilis]EXB93681.1 Polycystic kidney disease protein 1-like 2 [Morus notabilis]